jgi:hypothetical protein
MARSQAPKARSASHPADMTAAHNPQWNADGAHFRSGIRKIWTKWVIFPIRGFKGDAKAAEPNFVRSRSGRITGYRALDGVSFSNLRAATGVALIGANGRGRVRAC